ncbi:unnamed protein product, partial [Ectocarpus sp. 13 AM-2016]
PEPVPAPEKSKVASSGSFQDSGSTTSALRRVSFSKYRGPSYGGGDKKTIAGRDSTQPHTVTAAGGVAEGGAAAGAEAGHAAHQPGSSSSSATTANPDQPLPQLQRR